MSIEPSDEYMHANTGEANFNESMYFNFYDRAARIGAFARIGNRPNERYAEMTIAVYQPDGTALFNYKRPEIADNSAFDAGGMRFDVVTPMESAWRLKTAWPQARFEVVWDAGHASTEPGIVDALVRATDAALKLPR